MKNLFILYIINKYINILRVILFLNTSKKNLNFLMKYTVKVIFELYPR